MGEDSKEPWLRMALFIVAAVALLVLAVLAGLQFPNKGGKDSAATLGTLFGVTVS